MRSPGPSPGSSGPGRRAPGRRLLVLIRPFVSRRAFEGIFVQAVRDLQEEWEKAARTGARWAALRVRIRGYASVLTAVGAHAVFAAVDAPSRRLAMSRAGNERPTPSLTRTTANDRFKRSFDSRLWGSIIAATVLHLLFFTLFPTLTAADVSVKSDDMIHVPPPPPVDIPEAPEALTRPARPVATADVPVDITIPINVPEDGGFAELPPPPRSDGSARRAGPTITPHTLRPRVTNRAEVSRALEREYPALLRDSGIDGRVVVWFLVDEEGRVRETRIHETSGQAALDAAALDVAHVFQFAPAMNLDEPVAVWIQIPIVFEAR